MASNDALESRRIVRMYSWDVEERLPPGREAHALGQVLSDDRGDYESLTAPWRKFFEPRDPAEEERNPITEVIAVESAKLREKWAVFQKNCPQEDRLDLQSSEPTVEGVTDVVNNMLKAWQLKRGQGRRGRTVSRFHSFCRSLESHSAMIKLLPEGNEYVSVFTGSLNAVIKASVNHDRISESLSEALCIISEHIIWSRAELQLFLTTAMLELVADLYAHIFLFLSGTMDWIMKTRYKRMLDSFNETLQKKFDDEITNISRKAERIRNLADQSSHAEVRATRLTVEQVGRDFRIGLNGDARERAEMRHLAERIEKEMLEAGRERANIREERRQLATYLKHMLQEGALRSIQAKDTAYVPLQLLDLPEQFHDIVQPAEATLWHSEDVLSNSRHLEDFFHRDRVRLAVDSFTPVMVNQETLGRLSDWTESTTSQVLWLEGSHPSADDFNNPVTMVAAKYLELAGSSRVPVMSYFCELRRNETVQPGNTKEAQAMISLAYALLRQMVELLLPRFHAKADLSESRFRGLDGTVATWDDSLSVFRALLELLPDTVFCVIDGFHWLDDGSTETYLTELVQLLTSGKLKVLFTTTERSKCLREEISAADTVEVESLNSRTADSRLDRGELWAAP